MLAPADIEKQFFELRQVSFVGQPPLRPGSSPEDPMHISGATEPREPLLARTRTEALPEREHTVRIERIAFQMRLFRGYQHQGIVFKGHPAVDAARVKPSFETSFGAFVRNVYTLLTTLESDAQERDNQLELFELAFVYRAHVAAGRESVQCPFKRQ